MAKPPGKLGDDLQAKVTPDLPGSRPLTPAEYAHAKAIVASALTSNMRLPQQDPEGGRVDREVELAELEVRVRDFCQKLILPTVNRVTVLEHEQGEIKADAQRTGSSVGLLSKTSDKVEAHVKTVDSFREELAQWDMERRNFQAEAAEKLASMRMDIDNMRYQLERQDASNHSLHRTMDRVVGQLTQVQEVSDNLRQYVDKRLEQQGKLLNTKTTDFEVKLVSLEARHSQLSDDLWGEETGLAKVTHDLAATDAIVSEHGGEIQAMREDKASLRQVEAVQEEVHLLKREANNHIHALRETVSTMIENVKSHFETATDTVAQHNAELMKEMRISFQDELNQSAKLRTEIMNFMQNAQVKMTTLEETFADSQASTDDMVQRVSGELDTLAGRLHRERSNDEMQTKSMREHLSSMSTASAAVSRSLEHLSSVVWKLLQSERAASALDRQDASDRGKVALMGYRDGPPHAGGSRHAGAGTRAASGTPRPRSKGKGAAGDGAVISVDHRCLSCSGQAQTVLSGFKMACLQYTPGPVDFARRTYDRGELLELRERLLGEAHVALDQGPIRILEPDPFSGKDPPPPRAAGSPPGREEWKESRSSLATTGSPAHSLPPLSARTAASR